MFYVREFSCNNGVFEKDFSKGITFYIFTGTNIVTDKYKKLWVSDPPIRCRNPCDLNAYNNVVVGIYNKCQYICPSVINYCLSRFDTLFNIAKIEEHERLAFVSISEAEELYVEFCNLFGKQTQSIVTKIYYCKNCEGKMNYNNEKCWACEKGI